jgi:hypothetical protein
MVSTATEVANLMPDVHFHFLSGTQQCALLTSCCTAAPQINDLAKNAALQALHFSCICRAGFCAATQLI